MSIVNVKKIVSILNTLRSNIIAINHRGAKKNRRDKNYLCGFFL